MKNATLPRDCDIFQCTHSFARKLESEYLVSIYPQEKESRLFLKPVDNSKSPTFLCVNPLKYPFPSYFP